MDQVQDQEKVVKEKSDSGQGWMTSIGLYVKGGKIVFKHENNNYCEGTYLGCEDEYDIQEYRRAIEELRATGKCVVKSKKPAETQVYYDLTIEVASGVSAKVFGKGLVFSFCSGVCNSSTVFTGWSVEDISV